MSINKETFELLKTLSAEDMVELVDTVIMSVLNCSNLKNNTNHRIIIATNILACAHQMLEQHGCRIRTEVSHDLWENPSVYVTGEKHE